MALFAFESFIQWGVVMGTVALVISRHNSIMFENVIHPTQQYRHNKCQLKKYIFSRIWCYLRTYMPKPGAWPIGPNGDIGCGKQTKCLLHAVTVSMCIIHTNFFRTSSDHTSINCQKIRKFCKIFLYDTDPTKMSRLHRVAWLLIDLRQYIHILIYMHAYTYIKLIWPTYDTTGCYDVANVFSRFVTLFPSTIHHRYCYNDKETYKCIIYIRFENVRRHAHTHTCWGCCRDAAGSTRALFSAPPPVSYQWHVCARRHIDPRDC